MKIYVARHGKTLWNEQNRICGRTDIELSETGIAQAKALAAEVKKYNIDYIISSPLKRALQTSAIVSEGTGIPIVTDNRLIEQGD